MKKCANCGLEIPDETISCPSCSTDTFVTSSPEAVGHIISPAEQNFWERMTFRQFAVFFIWVQSFWLFTNALIEVSYLLEYFVPETSGFVFTPHAKMIVVRIAIHVALGIFCLRYADRVVSWFVKDLVPKTPPATIPLPGNSPEA